MNVNATYQHIGKRRHLSQRFLGHEAILVAILVEDLLNGRNVVCFHVAPSSLNTSGRFEEARGRPNGQSDFLAWSALCDLCLGPKSNTDLVRNFLVLKEGEGGSP